jgi:spore coat protein CotH
MTTNHVVAAVLAIGLSGAAASDARAQTTDDLFNDRVVQEIRLTINKRTLSDMRADYLSNDYHTADFQWRNIRIRNLGVRMRGVGSRSRVKLGLRIDFNRFTKGQEFLGLKSIVLDNHWQDGTFMHEFLTMALYARLGYPAPRIAYCRLYINDESQGLYSIVESIDNKFLARTIGESDGYLYSFQHKRDYLGDYLGRDLAPYKEMFEPQSHEKEADTVLYAPLHDLIREINQPMDSVWRQRVDRLLDLEQFTIQSAFEAAVAELDGVNGAFGINNIFVYRPVDSTRHRFFLWDKDSAFDGIEFDIFNNRDKYRLLQRVLSFGDLRELYLRTLEETARSAAEMSEDEDDRSRQSWLEREINRVVTLITGEVRADSRKPFSTEDFQDAVEYMKNFARERPAFVLREVARARQGQGR